MSIVRSPYWMFTINNPTESPQFDDVKYMIYQFEKGEQGTVHIQGYVVFNERKRMTQVKKMEPRAHLEVRRGTHLQAKEYCSKEASRIEGPIVEGDDSDILAQRPGKRNDCLVAAEMIRAGSSIQEVMSEVPASMRFVSGLRYYHQLIHSLTPRTWKTYVRVYWGVAGSGKSYAAANEAGGGAYFKPGGNKWFDGYNGEDNVVFDEFRGNWFDLSTLLRLLDAYPCKVETKGGMVEFVARNIWITSNVSPENWYPNIDAIQLQALLRRLDEVRHFINVYQP